MITNITTTWLESKQWRRAFGFKCFTQMFSISEAELIVHRSYMVIKLHYIRFIHPRSIDIVNANYMTEKKESIDKRFWFCFSWYMWLDVIRYQNCCIAWMVNELLSRCRLFVYIKERERLCILAYDNLLNQKEITSFSFLTTTKRKYRLCDW